jgi:NhaP-type Na+/H+ or K+/H+ antiporter
MLFVVLFSVLGVAAAGNIYIIDGDAQVLVYFLFVGLLCGGLISHFLSHYRLDVPYTVVVFIFGACLLSIENTIELGSLGKSISSWRSIDPTMTLYLFLPILVFGEAMRLSWFQFKTGFAQAFVMAVPGVLIGTYLMALFAWVTVPYDWSWNLSVVLGSILASTDTAAVLAVLKTAGASSKLTMLVTGESLFNDGMAMVLFNLYFDRTKGTHRAVVRYLLNMLVWSPVLGVLMGLAGVALMSIAKRTLSKNDVTFQITVTVSCAYLTFFFGDYLYGGSGILACCSAGIMFARLGQPVVLEPETMDNVWAFLEWVANTLLFEIAGMVVADRVWAATTGKDWLYLLVLYLGMNGVRALTVASLFPVMSRIGMRCDVADAVFMSWSGLRGALGIALALIVQGDTNESKLNDNDADRVLFYVGGMATMTLLLNATSAKWVLRRLGLVPEDTVEKTAVLAQVLSGLKKSVMEEVRRMEGEMGIVDIGEVTKYSTLFRDNAAPIEVMSRAPSTRSLSTAATSSELTEYVRTVFLSAVRARYWKLIEDGHLLRKHTATKCLLFSVDLALDRVHLGGASDWRWLKKHHMQLPLLYGLAIPWLCKVPGFRTHCARILSNYEETRVHILTNFINAHSSAQKLLPRSMGISQAEEETSAPRPEQLVVIRESERAVSKHDL